MAARANWKGYLKVGELSCAVALYTAASTSERIAFHMLNRKTGNRLNREFVDSDSGKPVGRDDQVKGYEIRDDDYIVLEPEDIEQAVPESDKLLDVETFIACGDIDDVYFDRPYYLAPADAPSRAVFGLIRQGLAVKKAAAVARTVLFRRLRTVLIRPHGDGMIASTLKYHYEVRPAKEAFDDLSERKIEPEMLDLASHIIDTKRGKFEPAAFDDRYEAALAELVKAKLEGRKIEKPKPPERGHVVDLMEALRQSAGGDKPDKRKARRPKAKAAGRKAASADKKMKKAG